MKISIIGLGRYGELLGKELLKKGYFVSGTTRTEEKKTKLEKAGFKVSTLLYPQVPQDILCADIIILNIPPFEKQLDWYKSWPWKKNTWIIFISSTSVVPIPDSENGFLLKEEEDWFRSYFQDTTILRFGGLISETSHPGKYLSGRKSLPGKLWPVNLIHMNDTVDATCVVLEKKLKNITVNIVTDEHPMREEFYSNYCQKHQLPLPQFDQNDLTKGKIISNSELKNFFIPKRSIWDC